MTDERRDGETETRSSESTQEGEPGRTPGSAEGDRETVEESLAEDDREEQ